MQFSGLAVQQVDRTEVKQMLEIEWQCIRLSTFQLIGEQICITIMVNPSNIKTINVFVCLFKFGLLKFFLSPKHADEKRAQGTVMFHTPMLSGLTLFCQCFVRDINFTRHLLAIGIFIIYRKYSMFNVHDWLVTHPFDLSQPPARVGRPGSDNQRDNIWQNMQNDETEFICD